MINPEKVLGFLDIFGNWDPSFSICDDRSVNSVVSYVSFIKKKGKNQYLKMNLVIRIIKI